MREFITKQTHDNKNFLARLEADSFPKDKKYCVGCGSKLVASFDTEEEAEELYLFMRVDLQMWAQGVHTYKKR